MNTQLLLLVHYGKVAIPLSEICEEYFGCAIHTAVIKAKASNLAVPAFKVSKSQKSTWMVHIADLAIMIDRQRELALLDWENCNN